MGGSKSRVPFGKNLTLGNFWIEVRIGTLLHMQMYDRRSFSQVNHLVEKHVFLVFLSSWNGVFITYFLS